MKHSRYFAKYPDMLVQAKHEVDSGHLVSYRLYVYSLSRAQLDLMEMPSWKQWQVVSGDKLAFRLLLKNREGWQTLHNCIRMDHNLAKRY